jgi:hypothetical protein
VPPTPTSAPYNDNSYTTTDKVKILIDAITGNGGSPILSYSLEVDDGMGG